jgi:hypothetical protein
MPLDNLYNQMMPGYSAPGMNTPGYLQNAADTTASGLKPQLQEAITNSRQNLSNRGMLNSGLASDASNQIGSNYMGDLANSTGGAALHAAGVNQNFADQQALEQQKQNWEQGNINQALAEKQREFWVPYGDYDKQQDAQAFSQVAGDVIKGMGGGA